MYVYALTVESDNVNEHTDIVGRRVRASEAWQVRVFALCTAYRVRVRTRARARAQRFNARLRRDTLLRRNAAFDVPQRVSTLAGLSQVCARACVCMLNHVTLGCLRVLQLFGIPTHSPGFGMDEQRSSYNAEGIDIGRCARAVCVLHSLTSLRSHFAFDLGFTQRSPRTKGTEKAIPIATSDVRVVLVAVVRVCCIAVVDVFVLTLSTGHVRAQCASGQRRHSAREDACEHSDVSSEQ
jgi:hypothetical protein